eukprot:GHVO01049719.1.p1 GENE.GHVO01049719.1~~GHVO01049719.1.p1  ORF type:complete len:186 (+),score=29.45 GHVO01049719.1:194-751(+)
MQDSPMPGSKSASPPPQRPKRPLTVERRTRILDIAARQARDDTATKDTKEDVILRPPPVAEPRRVFVSTEEKRISQSPPMSSGRRSRSPDRGQLAKSQRVGNRSREPSNDNDATPKLAWADHSLDYHIRQYREQDNTPNKRKQHRHSDGSMMTNTINAKWGKAQRDSRNFVPPPPPFRRGVDVRK